MMIRRFFYFLFKKMRIFLPQTGERKLFFYFFKYIFFKICTFNIIICLKIKGFTSLHSTNEVPKQTWLLGVRKA